MLDEIHEYDEYTKLKHFHDLVTQIPQTVKYSSSYRITKCKELKMLSKLVILRGASISSYKMKDTQTPQYTRLKKKALEDGNTGIRRAMITIARWKIYSDALGKDSIDEDSISKCKEDLREWCGFVDGQPGWLPAYYKHLNISDQNSKNYLWEKNNDNKFIKDITWSKSWTKHLNDGKKSKNGKKSNNINAIYYDGIIADAIDAGPLKCRYLVVSSNVPEKDNFLSLKKKIEEKEKNLSNDDKDRILKTVAAFLLFRTNENQQWACINFQDLSNWLKTNNLIKNGNPMKILGVYMYKKKPLFNYSSYCNRGKIWVNPDWINKYNIKVLEKTSFEEYLNQLKGQKNGQEINNFIYFEDKGGGKLLECHTYPDGSTE